MTEKREILNILAAPAKKADFEANEHRLEQDPLVHAVKTGNVVEFNNILVEHAEEYFLDDVLVRCMGARTFDAAVSMMTSAIKCGLDAKTDESICGLPKSIWLLFNYFFIYNLKPKYNTRTFDGYDTKYVDRTFERLKPVIEAIKVYMHVDFASVMDKHYHDFFGEAIYCLDINRVYIFLKFGANPNAGYIRDDMWNRGKYVTYDDFLNENINHLSPSSPHILKCKAIKALIMEFNFVETVLKTADSIQSDTNDTHCSFEWEY